MEGTSTAGFTTKDVQIKMLSNKAGIKGFFFWILVVLSKKVTVSIIILTLLYNVNTYIKILNPRKSKFINWVICTL